MFIVGNVSDSEWNHVRTIGQMHNGIVMGNVEQSELTSYIVKHEKELSTPTIASILLKDVEISHSYIKDNPEYCQLVYRIIETTDFKGADIGLRGDMRKAMFMEFVQEVLLSEEPK